MAIHPGGEEIRFVPGHGSDERGDADRGTGSEAAFFAIGGFHDPGQEHGAHEGDDGEDDKREGADTADFAESVGGCRGRVRSRVAVIGFAYPGGAVNQEWKPAWIVSAGRGGKDVEWVFYLSTPKIESSRWPGFGRVDSWWS